MTEKEKVLVENLKDMYVFEVIMFNYSDYRKLGMKYDQRIIDFFKRHNLYDEEMFDHLQKNSLKAHYCDSNERSKIKCRTILNKNGKVLDYLIVLPDVTDHITMLIQLHEIAHGIVAYKFLGKKYIKEYSEVLSFLVEKLYINEMNDSKVTEFSNYLDNLINEEDELSYKFGLYASEELIDDFDGDINKMNKDCKKLLRNYKKVNKK